MDAELRLRFTQWLSKQTYDSLQQACQRHPELTYGVEEIKVTHPALIPTSPRQALINQARRTFREQRRRYG